MRRAGLRTRLARLEREGQARSLPLVISNVYDHFEAEVIGYRGQSGNTWVSCLRGPGETLAALQDRAFATIATINLAAIYSADARQSEPDDDLPPSPVTGLSVFASPCVGNPTDPFALAGIGRRASRAELERMGALPVPAERII